MIDFRKRLINGIDGLNVRQIRALEQDDANAEPARGDQFGMGGNTAAVLGNDRVDAVRRKQVHLVGLPERAPRQDVGCIRHRERRFDRVDAANEVSVLRRGLEGPQLLPAEGEKNAARLAAKHGDGVASVFGALPMIVRARLPWRAAQRQQCNAGCHGGFSRIARDLRGIGMGCVDQQADGVFGKVSRQTVDAAKSADANRNGMGDRIFRAASERKAHIQISAPGKAFRQLPRFGRSTQDENASLGHVR